MLVSQLSKSIASGIEYKEVLKKIYDNRCSISESNINKNTHLTRVDVINLPGEDTWSFQSEIQDIECLRSQNSTVERTILHLNEDKLYAYMIELKSGLSKGDIEGLKGKFTCSLVTLTLYLSSHPYFSSLANVEIFPVGIVCFNENTYQINHSHKPNKKHYHTLKETVFKFNPKKDFHRTGMQIDPVTLNRMAVPVLFFQNSDWLSTPPNMTNEFSIDFNRFSV